MAVGTQMKQRRDTAANWATSNVVLGAGELGVTTDTGIIKIGNGTSHWVDLPVAFSSDYLPILGTAANSALLGGVSVSSLVKYTDGDTAATPDKFLKRLSDGRAKAAAGTASDDLIQKSQLDAVQAALVLTTISQTVTAAVTLALSDQSKIVAVNNSSLTTNVVVTIPANTTVAFPVGSVIEVLSIGVGGSKIVGAAGVTLNGSYIAYPGYGAVRLVKTATNTWMGLGRNAHKRLPKCRVYKTGSGTTYTQNAETPIPWTNEDTTSADVWNPDHEWFTMPANGLATARRVTINKDGEYLVQANLPTTGSVTAALYIVKMVNDNTTTGATKYCNAPALAAGAAVVQRRFSAGDTIGAAYQPLSANSTDEADGTFGNRCDLVITRLSD
jgi:hypothetical protein